MRYVLLLGVIALTGCATSTVSNQAASPEATADAAHSESPPASSQPAKPLDKQQVDALREWVTSVSTAIRRNWKRPAGEISALPCTVRVKMLPNGEVVEVRTVQSCGAAWDDSVIKAVFRSDPLPVPADPSLFDSRLTLTFFAK